MATAKAVKVGPDSELSRRLRAAETSGEPVLVDTGEGVYTLLVSQIDRAPEDIFANYDPQRALEALRASRGVLKGVDTAQLVADLAEQREQDSHGRPEH
jgi:hypothetical protein